MQELIRGAVIQLRSQAFCLFPVPSCVYPRKHFCLVGSESPRSGSPSPARREQEGEWGGRRGEGERGWERAAVETFLQPPGFAWQFNARIWGGGGRRGKQRCGVGLLLCQLVGSPTCWGREQPVPAPVLMPELQLFCSLVVLWAGWGTATELRTSAVSCPGLSSPPLPTAPRWSCRQGGFQGGKPGRGCPACSAATSSRQGWHFQWGH